MTQGKDSYELEYRFCEGVEDQKTPKKAFNLARDRQKEVQES